jgi:hypothetical protein
VRPGLCSVTTLGISSGSSCNLWRVWWWQSVGTEQRGTITFAEWPLCVCACVFSVRTTTALRRTNYTGLQSFLDALVAATSVLKTERDFYVRTNGSNGGMNSCMTLACSRNQHHDQCYQQNPGDTAHAVLPHTTTKHAVSPALPSPLQEVTAAYFNRARAQGITHVELTVGLQSHMKRCAHGA